MNFIIDKSTINSNPTTTTTDANSLRDIIQDYGGILVKITDNTLDKNTTKTFIESLKKYRRKKGNKIGLAILVGESIELKSYELIDRVKDKNIRENLILIEKPDNPDLSLQALSNA